MSLQAFAHALGGSVTGPNRIACPGPYHSRRDRSLSVLVDPSAPDGFVVHSHAGDDALECKDFVRDRLGLVREPRAETPLRIASEDDAVRTGRALALWREASPPTGTPVESYLDSRGVRLPCHGPADVLRWHPDCPFGKDRVGCMMALVRDIVTDEPKAIHRTALTRDGLKRSDLGSNGRLTFGPVGGGAVKFTADEDVTHALAIGEGIESCLSIRSVTELSGMAVWSVLSASQVAAFPVLNGIETLWLVVDHDKAGVGSSEAARERWQDADREVITITPTMAGADLNDLTKGPSHD